MKLKNTIAGCTLALSLLYPSLCVSHTPHQLSSPIQIIHHEDLYHLVGYISIINVRGDKHLILVTDDCPDGIHIGSFEDIIKYKQGAQLVDAASKGYPVRVTGYVYEATDGVGRVFLFDYDKSLEFEIWTPRNE